jgi:hypothetical protein
MKQIKKKDDFFLVLLVSMNAASLKALNKL